MCLVQLIKAAEEKLLDLLPNKEKKRYVSLNHQTTPLEVSEAEAELSSWGRSVQQLDASLHQQKKLVQQQATEGAAVSSKPMPTIRGSGGLSASKSSGSGSGTSCLVGGGEQQVQEGDDLRDILALLSANQRKKLEKLRVDLAVTGLTKVKLQYKASKFTIPSFNTSFFLSSCSLPTCGW
jgi:hypothetical protein